MHQTTREKFAERCRLPTEAGPYREHCAAVANTLKSLRDERCLNLFREQDFEAIRRLIKDDFEALSLLLQNSTGLFRAISGGIVPAASLLETLSLSDPKDYVRVLQREARTTSSIERRIDITGCARSLDQLHRWQAERLLPIADFVHAVEKINSLDKESGPLRENLFNANLYLVVWWVNRLYGRPDILRLKNPHLKLDYLDLIQEGNIGLLTAVQRYRPDGGAQFASYASWWIRQRIASAVKNSEVIRIPAYMKSKIRETKVASQALQFDKSQAQMLANFDWLERVFRKEEHLEGLARQTSVPRTTLEGTLFGGDTIAEGSERSIASERPSQEPGPVEDSIRRENQQVVRLFVARLLPIEQKILLLRYGIPEGPTQVVEAVAQHLGISEKQIIRTELLALKKLRVLLKGHTIITDPTMATE